ncbi:MAG: NUDIX domain-containing protein [Flavobacteriales bacterium]|nr:NUDIX domain-containing protein [Flavobacteriales bacterium]MBK6946317.1 NUDIX domain-containing protein [Flavobacteriales bacterium]MBK7238731.1 NUDIX domain-containing protein [Flavobacteriales bacterium]MBK9536367.1 NUDIX domain-containing protein [Flavobacteriales bacterium]MBP9139398.1 NUDIX domain-containing protein [Flavobacteriales bacterium]
MVRRYTVYIENKPLVISESPMETPVTGVLNERIYAAEELITAIKTLVDHSDVVSAHLWSPDVERVWEEFKSMYKFVVAAGGAVIDEDGRLLVIKRLGKWDLPKGKVEPGEAIEAAAIREVQEECGLKELKITAPLTSTWHTYERKGKMYLKRTDWFLMRSSSKEILTPQTDEDIEEVRWMDAAEVSQMKGVTYPSLRAVVEEWEKAR